MKCGIIKLHVSTKCKKHLSSFNIMKKLLFFAIVIFIVYKSCDNNTSKTSTIQPSSPAYSPSNPTSSYNNNFINSSSSGTSSDETYHTNSQYKYEYRTGTSGDYEYNYDINGTDEEGNTVSGNIDISGKYGSGTIQDEDGNEKSIDAEWVDYGVLEVTDEDGNTYEMDVDD